MHNTVEPTTGQKAIAAIGVMVVLVVCVWLVSLYVAESNPGKTEYPAIELQEEEREYDEARDNFCAHGRARAEAAGPEVLEGYIIACE